MFDHCLYFNTTALARRLEREWADAFEPFGLTPPQAFLLRSVLNDPGRLQRDVAHAMAISRPTATRALDSLQAKGLIERIASERDGREQIIEPTPAARRIQAALDEASGRVTARLRRLLGPTTFSETVDRVRGIREALD